MVDEVHVDAASSGPSDMSATMRNTTSSKTANAGSSASTTNMSDFEMMNKRIGHHRSISQLIENIEQTSVSSDMGISNPSAETPSSDQDAFDSGHVSATTPSKPSYPSGLTASTPDDDHANRTTDEEHSGCFSHLGATSPDSEYDEELAFPDSVTILSMGGEPVLVERKTGDEDGDSAHHNNQLTALPFSTIYQKPVKFKALQRKVFIPGTEIHVHIVDNERSITSHLLNPNLYTIKLTHGPYEWTIKKRYKHIYALHQHLRVFRASLNFPFPTRTHKERRASFRNAYGETSAATETELTSAATATRPTTTTYKRVAAATTGHKKKRKGALPRFPNRPESLVPVESLPDRIEQLEKYLSNMLNIRLYRNHHETVNFLEVSQLSFVAGIGALGKEGPIMKRSGSTRPGQSGCNCMGCFHSTCCVRCNYFCSDIVWGQWRTRWFFVKETCFGYLNPKDGSIRCVVLFDQGFDVSTGIYNTGMRNGLQVITNCREMVLKSWTRRKAKEWMSVLKTVATNQSRDFTCPNPHMSFAPVRSSVLAAWFVDGASYMSAVADAMEAATEEIYIADWWLSPEIHMKRPAVDGDYWRLDKILKRKAEQGVKVFVLLYKEVELALGINSYYSKQRLVEAHENIKVFRHPDHARVGVFFWAHHEKIVAVDQTFAFVGGIDLCYGRWDDYRHRLTDLGSVTTGSVVKEKLWPLPDVTAPAAASHGTTIITTTRQVSIDVPDTPARRLPYLEPGDKLLMNIAATSTPIPMNTKRNTPEMERKNMLDKFKDNMKEKGKEFMARITTADSGLDSPHQDGAKAAGDKSMFFSDDELRDGARGDFVDPVPFESSILNNLDGQAKYWIGKDYVNFIIKDLTNLDAPYADIVDRSVTPRMPWHDIGAMVVGASARDISRHFIQRWNAIKLEKARENIAYPYLIPKTYNEIPLMEQRLNAFPLHRVTCQVLRSVSSWNSGFIEQDTVEQSIHDAYIQTITKAQHYIYIENQFFISMGTMQVKNQVADALLKRIVRAYKEQTVFRVYVVMPLLPAFEGDVGGTTGTSIRAITHWNYASICRGKNSIISRLHAAGIKDTSEYISFHSIRQHDILEGQPVTELIYVHSKLLIADDKVVIVGSANINDRSLIGKRDSEIALLITDEVFEKGCMNGAPFPTGVYAGQLRRFLFKEHLGLIEANPSQRMPIRVTDPIIDSFWNGIWQRTSERNTRIYDKVYKCIPTNAVTSFAQLKKYQEEPSMAKTDPAQAINESKRIQGNLVDMPFQFMWQEVLTPPGTSKEGLIPTSVWT